MRIAILGSGLMGSALGAAWARAGHTVAFSYSRDPAKLDALARDAGDKASAARPNEAVRDAEVVLVSVPWHRLDDALAAAGGAGLFAKKVVVSCSLPMLPDDSDLAIAHETSGAETLATKLPGARVVSAFNTIPSELIRAELLMRAGRREQPQVVICGDDASAKDVAARLAGDIGFTPVDAGPLRVSRYAEPFALLVAQLAYSQDLGPALGYRFLPEHDHGTWRTFSRDTPSHVVAQSEGSSSIATVSVYSRDNLDRNGPEVEQFRQEALQFVASGVAVATGARETPPGVTAPIGIFTFGDEQRPLPFEEVLEWLRTLSIVRLVEVEYHALDAT